METAIPEPEVSKTGHQWRSPQRRANWTLILIAIHILVIVIIIASSLFEIDLLQRIQDGETVTEAEAASNDNRQAILGGLFFMSFVVVAIAFLMWINRASKNLSDLGASDQKFSPAGAVVWWFIPIAWLWQPYRVVVEIWVESHPDWIAPPKWFPVWWGAWIVSNWLSTISLWIFFGNLDDASIDDIILQSTLEIASDAISIAAALLLIILVWRITANQWKKHQALSPDGPQ